MSYKEIYVPNKETAVVSSFPEQRIIFIFSGSNGYPGEEQEMTMTSFLEACKKSVQEEIEIRQFSGDLHKRQQERLQTLARGRTHKGKLYSHEERRQINEAIENDKKTLEGGRARMRHQRERLKLQGSWLIQSPGEAPLYVTINRGEAERKSGQPLSEEETAWRLFVYRNNLRVWDHPQKELVREHFNLRRQLVLTGEQEKAKIQRQLDDFNKKNYESVPTDLWEIMGKVSNYKWTPLFVWPKIS